MAVAAVAYSAWAAASGPVWRAGAASQSGNWGAGRREAECLAGWDCWTAIPPTRRVLGGPGAAAAAGG